MMSIDKIAEQITGIDLSSLGLAAGGATGAGAGAPSSGGALGGMGGMSAGAGRTLLMALPSMTEDIADAILDFIDADDEPREFGAEREYYSQLPIPYAPVNGPLQSIEQLLLVRGVTPSLLFGLDQNRNGVLEQSELMAAQQSGVAVGASSGAASTTSSTSTELPELGWGIYLTLYSKEKNVGADGTARININGADLATLQTDVSAAAGEDLATFIIAYRSNGAGAGGGPTSGGGAGGGGIGGGVGGPGGGRGGPDRGQGGGPGAGGPDAGGPGRGGQGGGGPVAAGAVLLVPAVLVLAATRAGQEADRAGAVGAPVLTFHS